MNDDKTHSPFLHTASAFISTAAVSSSPPPTTLTTYIFNGSVSKVLWCGGLELGLVGVRSVQRRVAHDLPVDVVEDVGKEVAARREGGKHVLDLGLCGLGCHA